MTESSGFIVSVLNTEELTEQHRSAVVEVCIAAHDNEAFRNLFTTFIPSGGRHFLGFRESELVSHAVVTRRSAQPEGQPILATAYVDAVATAPEHQGKGSGSAVMRRLVAEIGDYEIACLQTDEPGFYERLGWEVWRGELAGRRNDGLIPTPEQRGVMVHRLARTPPIDLATRLTIECQPDRIWE
jgi:aminoglycoside 2'-N-acetyltransferase I